MIYPFFPITFKELDFSPITISFRYPLSISKTFNYASNKKILLKQVHHLFEIIQLGKS